MTCQFCDYHQIKCDCEARSPNTGYVCTRESGHPHSHVACCDDDHQLDVWDPDPPTDPAGGEPPTFDRAADEKDRERDLFDELLVMYAKSGHATPVLKARFMITDRRTTLRAIGLEP